MEHAAGVLPEDRRGSSRSNLRPCKSTTQCLVHKGTQHSRVVESKHGKREFLSPKELRCSPGACRERVCPPNGALCPFHLGRGQEAAGRSRNADTERDRASPNRLLHGNKLTENCTED